MQAPDPVAFSLFGIDIMWYGVIIACAMALALTITMYRSSYHGVSSDRILNFCLICIPAGIIGARLYYVIFNWNVYSEDIFSIFRTRGGGLAIHGGLIFAFIAVVILCHFWKEKPLNLLDLAVPSVALAQSVGRWGNFINSEAHGGPTDLPWAITVDGIQVHPTFLYESIWCFILFLLLIYTDNRRLFTGQTFLLYCILYSIERFFVEGLRTDSLMLFGVIRQAQFLSILVVLAATAGFIYIMRSKDLNFSDFLSSLKSKPTMKTKNKDGHHS